MLLHFITFHSLQNNLKNNFMKHKKDFMFPFEEKEKNGKEYSTCHSL